MSKAAPSYRRKAAWSTIQRSVKDMNGLVTGNCAPSAPERPEMLTGADPALDGPVIVFQDIIEVLHRSVLAVLLRNTLGF